MLLDQIATYNPRSFNAGLKESDLIRADRLKQKLNFLIKVFKI